MRHDIIVSRQRSPRGRQIF